MVHFLNPLFLSFSFILLPHIALFAEITSGDPAPSAAPAALPHCINDQKTFDKIDKIQKEHAKKSRRYDGYREALGTSTDVELFTRLAYAETLAANCTSQNAEVSSLIVNVIGNRVLKRNHDIKSVVFERAQFASSLHNYSNSRFKDFLCPQDETLWLDIRKKSGSVFKSRLWPSVF
jgi:excinuclease UvrABC ATPase subunit